MALTFELRRYALKLHAGLWPVNQIISKIRENFGVIVNESDIRALDPTCRLLSPEDGAYFRQCRDEIIAGDYKFATAVMRNVARSNAAEWFKDNNQPVLMLDALDRIEAAQSEKQDGSQASMPAAIEWVEYKGE
jgi:hypothetical protein